jgi:hypothetical protein
VLSAIRKAVIARASVTTLDVSAIKRWTVSATFTAAKSSVKSSYARIFAVNARNGVVKMLITSAGITTAAIGFARRSEVFHEQPIGVLFG